MHTDRAFSSNAHSSSEVVVVRFGQLEPGLQRFIATLRQAAAEHDADTIYGALAWNYKVERDFGGSYQKYERPEVNFSISYELDNSKMSAEYADTGWQRLAGDLAADTFEHISSGEVCTLAGAMKNMPVPLGQLCFDKRLLSGWKVSKRIKGGD